MFFFIHSIELAVFVFFFLLSGGSGGGVPSRCSQTCGSVTVGYPFGFSGGCEIPLDCWTTAGNSSIKVGNFTVRSFTSDSLAVDVPPNCNRSVEDAVKGLFGRNYALTTRNNLFLRDCSRSSSRCVVDTSLFKRCVGGGAADNLTCFSNATMELGPGFLTAENITTAGCAFLFTSLSYESSTAGGMAVGSLFFRTAELGWWLEGQCKCSEKAECMRLTSPVTYKPAFRCRCSDGYEGDGYLNGSGCRKAKCNPSKYMSGNCGGTNRIAVLIGGIVAGASIMAGSTLLFCFFKRRYSSIRRRRKSMKRLLSQASSTVPLYTYKDVERATSGFSESQRLGTGAYGIVYAGKLSDDKLVAVKRIRNKDEDSVEQVMNEIKLLSSVSHPSLVRLLGCCIEHGEQILVYEYMPNGTLSQHLQRERGPPMPWTVRLKIAADTAKAIAYLHSAVHPPIYHRDIKSSNILLDFRYNSKVADFGLSRIAMTELSHISTAPQGTPGYLDPQYHQNFHLSDKSDVYSFGVVLVEIITAMKAVDFSRRQHEVNLAAMAIEKIGKGCVDEIIDPYVEATRDAWTLASIHKVAELAFRCLAFHQDMRPSMIEVADELEEVMLGGWTTAAAAPSSSSVDNEYVSTKSSICSSPSNCTEKSRGTLKSRSELMNSNVIDVSPISVHDPWFSEQSSPSTNSLLDNVVQ